MFSTKFEIYDLETISLKLHPGSFRAFYLWKNRKPGDFMVLNAVLN